MKADRWQWFFVVALVYDNLSIYCTASVSGWDAARTGDALLPPVGRLLPPHKDDPGICDHGGSAGASSRLATVRAPHTLRDRTARVREGEDVSSNKPISAGKRQQVNELLRAGESIRETVRLTGVSALTVGNIRWAIPKDEIVFVSAADRQRIGRARAKRRTDGMLAFWRTALAEDGGELITK